MSFDEREALFITYLRSKNVDEDVSSCSLLICVEVFVLVHASIVWLNVPPSQELHTEYRVSDALNMQRRPGVVLLNANSAGLTVTIFRKRRHALFLMMMLHTYGGGNWKSRNIQVTFKYRDRRQLEGDINSLEERIKELYEELGSNCARVTRLRGVPIKVPDIFKYPVKLPKVK